MTTRRSEDLPPPRGAEAPLPANVRPFPFIVEPHVVLEIAQRQRERATEKAVERRARRKRTPPKFAEACALTGGREYGCEEEDEEERGGDEEEGTAAALSNGRD